MSVFYMKSESGNAVRFDTGEKTAEEVLKEFLGSPKNGHYVDSTEEEYNAQVEAAEVEDVVVEGEVAVDSGEVPEEVGPEVAVEAV